MKDSVVLEWLDENRRRAFPLMEPGLGANNPESDLIVDALLITTAVFAADLSSIEIIAGVSCTITVSCGSEQTFVFPLPITSDYLTVNNDDNSKLTISSAVNNMPTGTTTYSSVYFEDCTTVAYSSAWEGVNSIGFLAFAEDLGLLNGYYLQLLSGDTLGLIAGSVPFVGDIAFYGRYQTRLDVKNNSLIWAVGKNYGTPLPACAPYGADDCGTQISYINGISPLANAFTFKTGAGVKVIPDKINHTLTFELDFTTADICTAIPPTP